ncbi:hypothetical protein AAVH_09075 [Aphelenchoides avenae]|nr:hypothetical protein AAVH_09075 [Aphelenchus avenae]
MITQLVKEKDLFADQFAVQRFVGQVLRELHKHYQSTYLDYAERLATLTSILGQFHEKFRAHEEFYTLLSLYDTNEGLTWKGFTNFVDLRRSIKL